MKNAAKLHIAFILTISIFNTNYGLKFECKHGKFKGGLVFFIVSPCIFVHLVLSPTYALIYIIKISQAVTLVALFTPTCFDPYGSSLGSTAGPC